MGLATTRFDITDREAVPSLIQLVGIQPNYGFSSFDCGDRIKNIANDQTKRGYGLPKRVVCLGKCFLYT